MLMICLSVVVVPARAEVDYLIPEMVLVKAGVFQMGDEVGDLWKGTRPVHEVTLTYDFLVARYPTTFREYDQFCTATNRNMAYDHGWGRDNRPVIYVNWWDAINYCNWLSETNELKPAYNSEGKLLDLDGNITEDITKVEGFRLLTDAEWEYSASGGHKAQPGQPRFLYSGSNNLDEVGWYSNNSGEEWTYIGSSLRVDYSRHGATLYEGKSTHPVGLKKPNRLGLYDMSGNVWEWCYDYYSAYTGDDRVNPIGALTGHVRVMRGGSWIFGANDCRIACRFYRSPHDKIFRIGFRIARTIVS